jgi:hypothetical protein
MTGMVVLRQIERFAFTCRLWQLVAALFAFIFFKDRHLDLPEPGAGARNRLTLRVAAPSDGAQVTQRALRVLFGRA